MNSDLIKTDRKNINTSKDNDLNFLKKVGSYLDFWGIPWKAYTYESSPHVKLIQKSTSDVVFLHNSLMCPGTILDVCSDYYQKLKGSRKFLWNYFTETEGYAFSVKWLPSARDDNFSPKSFEGLNDPVAYQVKHGAFQVSSSIDPRRVTRQLAMLAYEK